jgi:hypothetical protein
MARNQRGLILFALNPCERVLDKSFIFLCFLCAAKIDDDYFKSIIIC